MLTHERAPGQVLVVGAGFSGATIARELADAGHSVCVIDRRPHVGGNAWDYCDAHGIRVHRYGPHIFHTSNTPVFNWLSRFTSWHPYQHRVKAQLADGSFVTLPVNAETAAVLGADRIVDVLFRPYTRKMWGLDIEQLDPSILSRVSHRKDLNELYFPEDLHQCMPAAGYATLFDRMLDHPLIELRLGEDYVAGMEGGFFHCFNSMAIDDYFSCDLGALPYRSIKFHTLTLPMARALPVAVVNFTHDLPYTRITEWKQFPGNPVSPYTTLTYEEPCDARDNNDERYYPVKDLSGVNRERYSRYLARVPGNVTFIGRCGLYAYLDMHQAVSSALATARRYLRDTELAPHQR